ncbi:uncharacterized protein LOC143572056 [Bidens hawaiensis]|uniref:uncharacterized protein LOC143572056 n=1 Tax=Bidens hawaiensis TaxID=980011 RepID=UPI00404A918E
MASSQMSLFFFTLLALAALTSAAPTIYDLVNQFGFPSGIIPDSVAYYEANDADGTFVIYLKKPCYVKYEYLVSFDTELSGKISYGLITNVKGLKAQSPEGWIDIDEIAVVGSSLQFTLGGAYVQSDIALYVSIPTCKDNTLAACDHSSNIIAKLPRKARNFDRVIKKVA